MKNFHFYHVPQILNPVLYVFRWYFNTSCVYSFGIMTKRPSLELVRYQKDMWDFFLSNSFCPFHFFLQFSFYG